MTYRLITRPFTQPIFPTLSSTGPFTMLSAQLHELSCPSRIFSTIRAQANTHFCGALRNHDLQEAKQSRPLDTGGAFADSIYEQAHIHPPFRLISLLAVSATAQSSSRSLHAAEQILLNRNLHLTVIEDLNSCPSFKPAFN